MTRLFLATTLVAALSKFIIFSKPSITGAQSFASTTTFSRPTKSSKLSSQDSDINIDTNVFFCFSFT